MIQIIEFAILVIIISASGVMSPGPLFAANITYGLREGVKSGIKIARTTVSNFIGNWSIFFRNFPRI